MEADDAIEDRELTQAVIGIFYSVYIELGPGFLESIYENAMAIALREAGLDARQQQPLQVWFRGRVVGEFKVDLLVQNTLIVELKAVSQILPIHEVQLVNYLKGLHMHLGLLFNFGPKPQFKRRVHGYHPEDPRSSALIRVQSHV